MKNLFHIPDDARRPGFPEHIDALLAGPGGLCMERIISHGHTTPEGEWCNQKRDEWVAVLDGEARLCYADGTEVFLSRGEYLFLPKHCKHRVVFTSSPCIWLAVHSAALEPE